MKKRFQNLPFKFQLAALHSGGGGGGGGKNDADEAGPPLRNVRLVASQDGGAVQVESSLPIA